MVYTAFMPPNLLRNKKRRQLRFGILKTEATGNRNVGSATKSKFYFVG
jgi:hypothetical protein